MDKFSFLFIIGLILLPIFIFLPNAYADFKRQRRFKKLEKKLFYIERKRRYRGENYRSLIC